jgi:hypothetical protein
MSTDVSEVRAASIIRATMEAARTSETSIGIQLRTRQYIPEDSELHFFCCSFLGDSGLQDLNFPYCFHKKLQLNPVVALRYYLADNNI